MESLRTAISEDFESIYMMGFDAWGSNHSVAEYLTNCHTSSKYKQGNWWVLADEDNKPLSSLITYDLSVRTIGMGSLATSIHLRKRGYASKLLLALIAHLESTRHVSEFYLFADIEMAFYARFGFVALPKAHQRHQNSVCMIRAKQPHDIWSVPGFLPPKYF